jgi:hypothetical protein
MFSNLFSLKFVRTRDHTYYYSHDNRVASSRGVESSSSSSSAHYSPLLDIGLSNFSPFLSIFDYSHPTPASRPAEIVTPTLPTYTIHITETQSQLQNSFTPAVVGSTADVTSPLPFQRANTVCYVGDFSFLRVE